MGKLIAKLGLLALPLLLLFAGGYGIEHFTQWRSVQNPRTQILWGGAYNGADIVILGSSTFNSSRVDSEDQTLWARLAARSGKPVFAGSLDGAQTPDVLAAARLVAASWPAGSTVFVDVPPTKFLHKNKTSSTDSGNYASRFAALLRVDNPKHTPSIYLSNFFQPLSSRFFMYRNINEAGTYLKSRLTGRGAPPPLHNNRVWTDDPLAQQLFQHFSASLQGEYLEPYAPYFLGLSHILSERQIRLVFVMTGLNKPLIEQYAPDGGASLIGMFEHNRAELKAWMAARGLTYLDLSDAVPSACFADMVHTNACGDDALAAAMNTWLAQSR